MSRYGILKSKKFKEHLNQRRYEREVEERLEEERIQEQTRQRQISEKIEKEKRKLQETFESLKSDWRSELSPQEEQVEIVEELKIKVPEKLKSNWRKELNEGMITTNSLTLSFPGSDAALDALDAGDANSYVAGDSIDSVNPLDGFEGCAIVSNGTGSGSNGGFNLGKNHLSFNGIGFDYPDFAGVQNQRAAYFGPFDASRATTIEIMAIVGNGSNGGEAPSEPLYFGYGVVGGGGWDLTDDDDNPQIAVPANGAGTLTKYTLTLPLKARVPNMIFVLNQQEGTNLADRTIDNYGVTEVSLKRLTPVNVFASLDSPEAISFFRVGTGPNMETPEQRYRRIMQQLLASRSYTNQMFGSNYPGSNFAGLRGVSASPIGRQASYDTWSRASERNAARAASTFRAVGTDYQPGITFTTQYADPSDRGPYTVSVAGPTNVGGKLSPGRQSRTSGGAAIGRGAGPGVSGGPSRTSGIAAARAASSGRGAGPGVSGGPSRTSGIAAARAASSGRAAGPGVSGVSGGPSRTSGRTAVGRGGPLETVRGAARAAAAASAAQKIAPTARSYVQKGIASLNTKQSPGLSTKGLKVGATGVNKSGFDALTKGDPFKPSTKPQILGQGAYQAPKVGAKTGGFLGGTGASRYAGRQGSLGGGQQPGGVIGSLTPKGAPRIPFIDPQAKVPAKTFDKGARIVRDIQSGKYPTSAKAQQIQQQLGAAGFPKGQSSIPYSQLPKQAKPSFTPQQQRNINSVQSQLRGAINSPLGKAVSSLASSRNPISLGIQGGQILTPFAKQLAQQNRTAQQAKLNQLVPSGNNPYGTGKPAKIIPTPSQYNPGGGRQQYNQSRSSAPPPTPTRTPTSTRTPTRTPTPPPPSRSRR